MAPNPLPPLPVRRQLVVEQVEAERAANAAADEADRAQRLHTVVPTDPERAGTHHADDGVNTYTGVGLASDDDAKIEANVGPHGRARVASGVII
jgi:hypothetical protein